MNERTGENKIMFHTSLIIFAGLLQFKKKNKPLDMTTPLRMYEIEGIDTCHSNATRDSAGCFG